MDENGNPIDPNGDNPENPAGSQPEIITAGDGNTVNPEGAANLSPEEVEFNSLKGPTQDRIKSILHERDLARQEAEMLKRGSGSYTPPPPPPANFNQQTPDAAIARTKLDEIGMAPKDYVDQKINQSLGQMVYQMELDKLSNKFDGANGLPRFDRTEYEDYTQRHPQYRNYSPEDVYEKMYSEEIFDWRSQNQGRNTTRPTTTSLKPTKTTVREEVWTPDYIESRLQEPDGPQWLDKNRDKINAVLAKMNPNS